MYLVLNTVPGTNICWMNKSLTWHHSEVHYDKSFLNTLYSQICLLMFYPSTIKKAECRRIDTFELPWRRLLRVPWTARRSNQSILKEISPGCSLEDWCWSWNSNTLATWCKELICWKRPWCWERLKVGREGDDKERDSQMPSLIQWT